jgi:hypothetical protein
MQGRGFRTVTPVLPARELARPEAGTRPLGGADPGIAYDRRIATGLEHGATAARGEPGAPISTLRGAGVDVDSRRVAQAAVVLCLGVLAMVSAVLFVAGASKNAQISELREHGAWVGVTVSSCRGLLGGSGSNAAGYACQGTYTFDGKRYQEAIPGNVRRTPGTSVAGIVAPDDPQLLSTPSQVRIEHASWRVFIAPGALTLAFLVTVAAIILRWRSHRRAAA